MSGPDIDPLARLERWAQMLWARVHRAATDPAEALRGEREHLALATALSQLQGARMVLDGEALEAAETLYDLAWRRIVENFNRRYPAHTQTDTQQQEAA